YRAQDPMAEELTDPEMSAPPGLFSQPPPSVRGARDSIASKPPSPLERSISIAETVPAEALKRLYQFSARINESPTLDALKRTLVDSVIKLADADTGFMVLISEGGTPEI